RSLRLNVHHGLGVLSASHRPYTASHTAVLLSAWEQWAHRRSHTAHSCRPRDAAAPLGSRWLAGALPRLTDLRPRHSAGPWLAPPNLGPECWYPDGGRARLCPDAPQGGRDDAAVAGGGLDTRPRASPHRFDDNCPLSSLPRPSNLRARCKGASLLMTVSSSLHRAQTD